MTRGPQGPGGPGSPGHGHNPFGPGHHGSGGGGNAPVSGTAIVQAALRYEGHPYVWGGWDCSGMVNHVLGHDLGITLPGGIKNFQGPPPHGPVVAQYAVWNGATTVSGPPSPGDLCVWAGVGASGHIGIAISGTEMISALNPSLGTRKSGIQGSGPAGAPLSFRRVNAAGSPGGLAPGLGCTPQAAMAATLLIGGSKLWTTLLWNQRHRFRTRVLRRAFRSLVREVFR